MNGILDVVCGVGSFRSFVNLSEGNVSVGKCDRVMCSRFLTGSSKNVFKSNCQVTMIGGHLVHTGYVRTTFRIRRELDVGARTAIHSARTAIQNA
jgi:hypothetical protein